MLSRAKNTDFLSFLFTYTSTDLLRQLHWLPIEWQTKFKLASLTYKALHRAPSRRRKPP